jgi:hypothetical protein
VTSILELYEPYNIVSLDETGLFYNILYNRTIAINGDRYSGGKMYKNRA